MTRAIVILGAGIGGLALAKRLVAAMAALFARLGGALRHGNPVARIEIEGERATNLSTPSGFRASGNC